MHRLLFQNRFNALVFVAIILFSVRILVGTNEESGALEKATEDFGATPVTAQAAPRSKERAQPAAEATATEFMPDEDLIDDAAGFDPSGWSSEPIVDAGPDVEVADDDI